MSKNLVRVYTASFLFLVAALGFICKFYPGPGQWWFNNYGAGLLYEIFWILLVFFVAPTRKPANRIPVCVFIITSVLEFFQLSHPWFLEEIRSYFLGRVLIGTTFTWWDFPHYAIGCVIGWLAIRKIAPTS